MILTKVDDPRFLTVVVAALFSAALWIATWSVMGSMDMAGMEMSGDMKGMEMPADKPMAMDGMKMDATPKMDGMADKPMDGMKTSGGAMQMDMFGMSMDPTDWSARTIAETSAMWLLMMAAMMLPAMVIIMIPLFAASVILENPNGTVAQVLTYVPTATPIVFLIRLLAPPGPPAWEIVRRRLGDHRDAKLLDAYQFVVASPVVKPLPPLIDYAAASFPAGCPTIEYHLCCPPQ